MDSTRFDYLVKTIGTLSTRRATLGLLSALGLGSVIAGDADAKRNRKKKKCKRCGPCRRCKRGKCKPKPDGSGCGSGATCQSGACVCPTDCCADADCADDQVCEGGQCVADDCPPGQKPCQGGCIPNDECCGGCPAGQECCTNVGECKDTRNDADFCGQCANGQCPGGAFCANGACSVECTTIGLVCFAPICFCSNRVDPAHSGQNVCAEISPFTCDNVATCTTDADCSPTTQGFRQVCVSDLCAGKNVCADPCA